MPEVVNVTNLRGKLLKSIDTLGIKGEIIITRDYKPAAVLIGISEYEKKCLSVNASLPALMVLGAKKCRHKDALKTIKTINSICKEYYSKVIFVYGNDTKIYCTEFKTKDLRAVFNKKSNLPIITSLKCGITAISSSDRYFIVVFLSQPQDKKTLILMSNAVLKSNNKIIISRRNGKPVHPIAFSADCKIILIKTRKELGIPHIIKKFRNEIRYMDI